RRAALITDNQLSTGSPAAVVHPWKELMSQLQQKPSAQAPQWHSLSCSAALDSVGADETGLTATEAAKRLRRHGPTPCPRRVAAARSAASLRSSTTPSSTSCWWRQW